MEYDRKVAVIFTMYQITRNKANKLKKLHPKS